MSSLFVDRRDVELEYASGALVFRQNGERIGTVPLAPLSRVFLRGSIKLSASLLGQLGENGVGVVILSGRQSKPTLMLARPHNDASRRVWQIKHSLDSAFCLDFSRRLIDCKIERQIAWFDELRQSDMMARYELSLAIRQLEQQRAQLGNANNLATLRGQEGAAAACYFAGLRAVVPASLNFSSRNRRPPKDPMNALLSLTYTLAHSELAIALFGAGFDPYVGFYHALDFGRESLASDLMEKVRPLCDSFCLKLVRQQIIRKENFSLSEAGCLLGKAGRSTYYAAYEKNSETLRAAINDAVEELAACQRELSAPPGTSNDTLPGQTQTPNAQNQFEQPEGEESWPFFENAD